MVNAGLTLIVNLNRLHFNQMRRINLNGKKKRINHKNNKKKSNSQRYSHIGAGYIQFRIYFSNTWKTLLRHIDWSSIRILFCSLIAKTTEM